MRRRPNIWSQTTLNPSLSEMNIAKDLGTHG